MRDPESINIEFTANKETLLVTMTKGPTVETFRITEDSLNNLFMNKYSTGYMQASQDGVIYLEERDGQKVVVIQRGLRKEQPIKWDDHITPITVPLTTPWTFMLFKLAPSGVGYTRQVEHLYVSSGPSLGALTPLYSAEFLGNVWQIGRRRDTNVCWGNTMVAPGGVVTIPSLVNIAGDFYNQQFTNHIERTLTRWSDFTETGRIPTESLGDLSSAIKKIWEA